MLIGLLGASAALAQTSRARISQLDNMGAVGEALKLSTRPGSGASQKTQYRLRADHTAIAIRQALHERRRLEQRGAHGDKAALKHRNDALADTLKKLKRNAAFFPRASKAWFRTQCDHIYVLSKLARYKEAAAAYAQLKKTDNRTIPAYTLRAVGDAYLASHKPIEASRIYRTLIQKQKRPSVDLMTSQYTALIESEQYQAAGQLLARLDKNTPVWIYRKGKKGVRTPNWQRTDVDALKVLDAAYRNHSGKAQRLATTLRDNAPINTRFINLLAKILRWRGEPETAQQLVREAKAYAPGEKATQINLAINNALLGRYNTWRNQIHALALIYPKDSSIDLQLKKIQRRGQYSFQLSTSFGRSNGSVGTYGSHDFNLDLRVNSPWTDDGLRFYVQHAQSRGSYASGSAASRRIALGGEWQWHRVDAWVQASTDEFHDKPLGAQLGLSQWLSDHWQYRLVVDTYSDQTPLRAERVGDRGRLYQAEINWRQNDTRSASLSVGQLNISDGNRRLLASLEYNQRIQASVYHQTWATLTAGASRNSILGRPYYDPKSTQSLQLGLEHDWLTWRHRKKSFTQQFHVTFGPEWQYGQPRAWGYGAQYGHVWTLSPTWSIHYAMGWQSHSYDGHREGRLYGLINIAGMF